MTTIYEIPPADLIGKVAEDLEKTSKIKAPDWAAYTKTGSHKERVPENDKWWFVRAASLLRKVYVHGPVGVQRLRNAYGGSKNRGVKPEKFAPAAGKNIRLILQDFDKLGFTEKVKGGRRITPKGRSYLDKIASDFTRKSK